MKERVANARERGILFLKNKKKLNKDYTKKQLPDIIDYDRLAK